MNHYCKRKQSTKKIEKRNNSLQKKQRYISMFLGIAILAFGGAYVWLITDISTQGFVLHDFKERVEELHNGNRTLELEARRLESLGAINEKLQSFSMVAPTRVEYLTKGPSQVALKR